MALDGVFLSRLRFEIESCAIGARIDKIAQPTREEIILHLRWRGGGGKLLLSAGANSPRIHFTGAAPENPKTPPMFCMFLRKHLAGAKLLAVRQIGLDRILHLEFEASNELGDLVRITVAVEIMGRHSNVIIIGPDNRILDALKRVDLETSSVRQVLPGMEYRLPPPQDRLSLLECGPADVAARLKSGKDAALSKALMAALQGVSALLCREIAHYACRGGDSAVSELGEDQWERLAFFLGNLTELVRENGGTPTMVQEPGGRPRDFSFLPIHQYGAAMLTRQYPSYSELLDAFYSERDRLERVKQRSGDLLRLLANTSDRISRKLAAQKEELLECANREQFKIQGDLINSNLHAMEKGQSAVTVANYYHPEGAQVTIPLDVQLTPAQNAQRYYALYRKADTAEKMLKKLIVRGEEELLYIDSVFDALTRAAGEAELTAIREELAQGGYVRSAAHGKRQKEAKLPPLRYRSSDGYLILAGRNNVQNDRLTLKDSHNYDIWLHTQKIPGSHTIIVGDGNEVPKRTIEQACIIAAYNSKARESSKVPVDFTHVRHVRKPHGAKPGMVIYDNYQTVIVDPDRELVEALQE